MTLNKTINDVSKSYQFINYNSKKEGEIAPYVILNINEIIFTISKTLNVSEINSYGYWGEPSKTSVTPYNKILFAVFSIKKNLNSINNPRIIYNLNFPDDALDLIEPGFL